MNIVVNEELKAYIDPMSPEEYAALERSILTEGCRDALVLWGEVLVDGHHRYGICQKHGLPFQTVQNTHFKTMEDVHLWMIDQHLGRRSISDYQRGVLALRKKVIVDDQRSRALSETSSSEDPPFDVDAPAGESPADNANALPPPAPLNSRESIAKAARLSSSQVVMIEKIQKQAAPELVAAVKSGVISINTAAAVASLPAEEQVSAANAGKDELKQAAKRVREAKRKPRAESAESASDDQPANPGAVEMLEQRVAELTRENDALRKQVADLQAQLAEQLAGCRRGARPAPVFALQLDLGDLRARQRDPGFQPHVGQHEAHHGLPDRVGVDAAVGTDGGDSHRGVGAGRPAPAAAELVERGLRGEQVDHGLRLRAGLEAHRARGGAVVRLRAAVHAQRAAPVFGTDAQAGPDHGREHQHAAGLGDQFARAPHGVIQLGQRGVDLRVDGRARRRAAGLVLRARRGASDESQAAGRDDGRKRESAEVHGAHDDSFAKT
jgi:hypothetical protein